MGIKILEGFFGALGDGATDRDYRLGGPLVLPMPRSTFEKSGKIQYDQSKSRNPISSKMACTIFSAMGCASDLTGHVWTEEEIKELLAIGVERGFKPASGWYLQDATKLVADYYSQKWEPLLYFRLDVRKGEFISAIEKGYTVQVGYKGSSDYNFDFKADGKLDNTDFGVSTYAHAIRSVDKDTVEVIKVDNYFKPSRKYNIYTVPKVNLPALIANDVFFAYGYVMCYKKDFEEMNTNLNIPLWGTKAYEAGQKAGLKVEHIDDVIGNAELEDMLLKLNVFNTKVGSVSRLRMLEAFRRMGKI